MAGTVRQAPDCGRRACAATSLKACFPTNPKSTPSFLLSMPGEPTSPGTDASFLLGIPNNASPGQTVALWSQERQESGAHLWSALKGKAPQEGSCEHTTQQCDPGAGRTETNPHSEGN